MNTHARGVEHQRVPAHVMTPLAHAAAGLVSVACSVARKQRPPSQPLCSAAPSRQSGGSRVSACAGVRACRGPRVPGSACAGVRVCRGPRVPGSARAGVRVCRGPHVPTGPGAHTGRGCCVSPGLLGSAARMGSSGLPGPSLAPDMGRPAELHWGVPAPGVVAGAEACGQSSPSGVGHRDPPSWEPTSEGRGTCCLGGVVREAPGTCRFSPGSTPPTLIPERTRQREAL